MPSERAWWISVLLAGSAWAQTAPPAAASFDAASIKPAKADARGYSIRPLPGRLEAENVTLQQLIAEAYHVYDFQIAGPKWTASDRYDLEAKTGAGPPATRTQLRELLQKLKALLVINWRQKNTARSQVRLVIEDILDVGLPRAYSPELYKQKCAQVFEHIYEKYGDRGQPTS